MLFKRHLSKYLKHYLKKYPIVTITGPRQSGKTTLAKMTCPDYKYISLEDPDHREYAINDPRGFLNVYSGKVVFDEIQNTPDLFSYLQSNVDENPQLGRFILTGSQQFLLNAKISQTLAGRIARLNLLPLSIAELCGRSNQGLWFEGKLDKFHLPEKKLYDYLFAGQYPRIYKHNLNPEQFFRDYIDTYVTRDLQQILNVGNLRLFRNFLQMLAARCGQLINLTSLGNDLGLSHTTMKRWISVLEASYIICILEPYYKNFNKRLIKAPKIYFLDSGLLCHLLRIKTREDLRFHPQIGGVFETFIISELLKSHYHQDLIPPLYFWRQQSGYEIDVLIEQKSDQLLPIEIKSSQTLSQKFFDHMNQWLNIKENPQNTGYLIYAGNEWQKRQNIQVIPWYAIS